MGRTTLDVVLLDANERQSLICAQTLGRAGLRVGALERRHGVPAFASRWCARTGVVPDSAHDPDAFVDAVIRWTRSSGARMIISVDDGSIEALRARRRDVEHHARLALPSEGALEMATSKPRTLRLAAELGIRVPLSVLLAADGDLSGAVAEIGLPIVVKPARSWNGDKRGGFRLTPASATSNTEALQAATAIWKKGGEVLLQEWIPNRRETISLFRSEGAVKARFAHVAERMYPPLGGSSVMRESVPLPADATVAAESLTEACGLEGYAEIEFRRDRAGAATLMEINPRLSASIGHAVRAGVNFPLLLHAWATGASVPAVHRYRTGVRMRWLGGDVRRLREALADPGRPDVEARDVEVRRFLTDSLRRTAYDYLTLDDPRPAVVATGAFVRAFGRELLDHGSRRGSTAR